MASKHQQIPIMKKGKASVTEQPSEYIKSQKESFRQHQKDLPFSEKMEIAFSLAKRDKIIQQAVLLPKTNKAINK
jgi:hypothetical protein